MLGAINTVCIDIHPLVAIALDFDIVEFDRLLFSSFPFVGGGGVVGGSGEFGFGNGGATQSSPFSLSL